MVSRRFLSSIALLGCLRVEAQQATALVREAEGLLVTDPARAQELARAALALEPEALQAHAILGRAAAQAGQPELAIVHLERALALGGESLQLELYLASALWETGRYADSEASFRRACAGAEGGPRGRLAWYQLGRLLLWLGRAPEAVPVLERAVALGPQAADVTLDWARALELAGDDRALVVFERAVRLAPDSPRALWGLAQALLAAGRREEGASALAAYRASYEREQAVVRAEGLVRAQLDQGWSLLRESRNDEAAAVFGQLGEGAEALEGLARSEAARGRHPEAVAILERAVSRYPDHPGLQRLLALERLAVLGREP